MSTFTDQHRLGAWFALNVWSGREQLTARHLESRGYEVFLPTYIEHKRWSDRVRASVRALFDGYLFCRLEEQRFAKAITAPGVIRIVGNGQRPTAVATDELDAIRRVVDSRLSATPWPFLRGGERVRVSSGPLRDVEGIVLRAKNQDRLLVSVSLLQRSVAVELDAASVELVTSSAAPPARRLDEVTGLSPLGRARHRTDR